MDQVIKYSFLYIFLEWVRVFIGDCPLSMLDFVDWLGSRCNTIVVFVFLGLFFFVF